jgi:Anti-sigma-K factor rskA/Putative zinc-finger
MTSTEHDEIAGLLSAAALDALDDDEQAAVERHVEGCAVCRAQLDDYREVGAGLAPEITPPPLVWDRIAGKLHAGPARPRAVWLGAVAAVVALVLGIALGRLTEDDPGASVAQLAAAARDEDGTAVHSLVLADGEVAAEVVITTGGDGFLENAALPAAGAGRTYQLWAFRDGEPLSIALLGDTPDVEAFRVPAGFDRLAVTVEPAAGSPEPTTGPTAATA